jgi:hypothetical protein
VCAVPGIEKYSYVWCAEIDVTFKGNLTKWLSDVRVADPKADFITWHASPPEDWPWGLEPGVYNKGREPRALFYDVPNIANGTARYWMMGLEHLRCWWALTYFPLLPVLVSARSRHQ